MVILHVITTYFEINYAIVLFTGAPRILFTSINYFANINLDFFSSSDWYPRENYYVPSSGSWW